MTQTQPTLFLGHGAPPLIDDPLWPKQLAQWSSTLTKPTSILIVSAHWEERPATLSPIRNNPGLTYDFWGFPQRYYQLQYDAPLAPQLGAEVERLLTQAGMFVAHDETRGLDHGAFIPLMEMFPEADIPVLQLSMPSLDPVELYKMGRALAPLREQGTLIIGSGFTTHNLRWSNLGGPANTNPPAESKEFDHWADEMVMSKDLDALIDWVQDAPAAQAAHPWPDHWSPLFIALGASSDGMGGDPTTAIEGFWFNLSKRSWQFN